MQYCNEVYTVKKSDIHFLSCSVCRQEVHHKCYVPLLSNDNGLIVNTPGFHYLCQSCEKDLIPGEEKRLKKQRQQANNEHDSKNCNETSCQEMKNVSNAKMINESVTSRLKIAEKENGKNHCGKERGTLLGREKISLSWLIFETLWVK